jgi:LysM repeat protein
MRSVVVVLTIYSTFNVFCAPDLKISQQEYVEKWKQIAIEQMIQYNIPASITLAQGILESASGNSTLAIKGNNHFGIKCHGWEGKKMYLDDDSKNECFRVYKSVTESFMDHSAFLTIHKRYEFLFDYRTDDYKSWAKGLKTAGYATNPKYANLLIDIIEDLKLHQYDKESNGIITPVPSIVIESDIVSNFHLIKKHENGVKYVVAKKGDTFYRISLEFGLKLSQLYRYNDFNGKKDVLEMGDVIYLQPKRRRKLFKKEVIVLEEEISLIELSQKYATNLKSIKRLNGFTENDIRVAKGKRVTLR